MPTDRELREISKKAMAKKREEKAKIKELKEKGLCLYEGEVIPVMEARKRGAQFGVRGGKFGALGAKFGAEHGHKGAEHAHKGAEHGWKGGAQGVWPGKMMGFMGGEFGVLGKEDGIKGQEYGHLGGVHGQLGAKFGKLGAPFGEKCPKEAQYMGQISSMVLRMEKAAAKYETLGEPAIQVNY